MADLKLKPHPTISKPKGPVLVCILDGWGENRCISGDCAGRIAQGLTAAHAVH